MTTAVTGLCLALARLGCSVELHVVEPAVKPILNGVKLVSHRAWRTVPGLSPSLWFSLKSQIQEADVVHVHSLWGLPNILPGLLARHSNTRLIVSPHGTLAKEALERSRWKKRAVWLLAQRRSLKNADCIHATAESEADDVRRLGFRQPIAIIPNGISIVDNAQHPVEQKHIRRLLFIGRLHPIKGLDVLIRAWYAVAHTHPDWELVIAGQESGSARGYQRELEGLSEELAAPRVSFVGPIYGLKKSEYLQSSELFVLNSYSENFGMVVAEALACGTPVITSKGTPWNGVAKYNCGWWIDNDVESLRRCLDQALSLAPQKLREMGMRGRQWMCRDYSWDVVAKKMLEVYQWALEGGVASLSTRLASGFRRPDRIIG